MPDVSKFKSKNDWMDACMHQVKKVEGKPQNEAVGRCLGEWAGKGKKKKKCASDILRKIAEEIKESMPYFETDGGTFGQDLKFEGLSKEDKKKVVDALEKGEEITLLSGAKVTLDKIKQLGAFEIKSKEEALDILKKYLNKDPRTVIYKFDDSNNTYIDLRPEKEKEGK